MENEDFIKWFDDGISKNFFTTNKYRSVDHVIKGVSCASGAFKKCFIFNNENYVLKFPYSFEAFTKGSEDTDKNACEDEMVIYEKAVEAGVEKILLKTEFIGYSKGGVPLYIQPKVTSTINMRNPVLTKKRERITKTVTDDMCYKVQDGMYYHSASNLWVKMLIVIYGKSFAMKFEKFSRKVRLGDLHNDNIGFIGCNPVILDYNYCGGCN